LTIPESDLIIRGDGFFSTSKESFFNPTPLNSVDLSAIPSADSVNYIVANYQKVERDGDWNIAQVYIDPKDINIDGNKLYFSLESPGLSQSGGEIAISSLEVTVNKPGWFDSSKQNVTPTATVTKKGEGLLSRIVTFFKNLWPFGKNQGKLNEVKSSSAGEKPSPTPSPALKERLKISVQNGGGAVGIAAKYANLLKQEGFKNVNTGNAVNSDFKNAAISFNKNQAKELDSTISEIEAIINKDYKIVNRATIADKNNINIILGQLPTPTPTSPLTPTASPSAH
jgi:hypothetical protein